MATNQHTGIVEKIYPDKYGTYISLRPAPNPGPKDGLFQLKINHPNYQSLFALALAAAVHGFEITIRGTGDFVSPTAVEEINYIFANF